MYERILVLLDGSNAAESVLPYVEEIAGKCGAKITLTGVFETGGTDTGDLRHAYTERIAQRVRLQLGDRRADEEATVLAEMLVGRTAREIARHVGESSVSLVAMAIPCHSSDGPRFLENVAPKVLRSASRPVLIAKVAGTNEALQRKRLVKRILLPLDTSETGELALPHAEALARWFDATISPKPHRPGAASYDSDIARITDLLTAEIEPSRTVRK